YGFSAPEQWFLIPEPDRDHRCRLSSDYCVIDDEQFFIVCSLEIPVHGSEEPFSWEVWVELRKDDFIFSYSVLQYPPPRIEPVYAGLVSTQLPGYPLTVGLQAVVRKRPGLRPLVVLERSKHPVRREQKSGITIERVQEIAETVIHGSEI